MKSVPSRLQTFLLKEPHSYLKLTLLRIQFYREAHSFLICRMPKMHPVPKSRWIRTSIMARCRCKTFWIARLLTSLCTTAQPCRHGPSLAAHQHKGRSNSCLYQKGRRLMIWILLYIVFDRKKKGLSFFPFPDPKKFYQILDWHPLWNKTLSKSHHLGSIKHAHSY